MCKDSESLIVIKKLNKDINNKLKFLLQKVANEYGFEIFDLNIQTNNSPITLGLN